MPYTYEYTCVKCQKVHKQGRNTAGGRGRKYCDVCRPPKPRHILRVVKVESPEDPECPPTT